MEYLRKKVLLFSGGLDSYILSKIDKFDTLLFLNTGCKSIEGEQTKIKKINNVKILDLSFLANFELENKIIPFRNYFFVLAAAQYGQDIYLASTRGDTTKDKDKQFALLFEKALSYYSKNSPAEKLNYLPCDIKICLPLINLTKTEIVRKYIDSGFDIRDLQKNSISCYSPKNGMECGECRSCLRKFIAFKRNNISCEFNDPSFFLIQNLYEESVFKNRDKTEIFDISEVLKCLKQK